jgi:flagellar FliL protein
MSAAAAAPTDAAPPAASGGKKKLIVILAAVLTLLLAGGGGAAYFMMKKKAAAAAAAAAEEGDEAEAKSAAKPDVKNAPTFVPLDPFTVNLADRDAERYAQVGMTLELANPKAGDLLKAYMPAIRNNILLALASKTAGQLMEHEGKVQLAAEVRAAALKPLGYTLKDAEPAAKAKATAKGGKEGEAAPEEPPIRAVHFSNFIIQ